MVEMRAYAMAHIAMLNRREVGVAPSSAGSPASTPPSAAAAHDVLVVEFGKILRFETRPLTAYTRRSWLPFQPAPPRIAASPWARLLPRQWLASRANEDVLGAL